MSRKAGGKVPEGTLGAPRLTAIDLFSGVGGMSLGLEQAGFDVLAAVDLDPVHLAAHQYNFPGCEPVCQDAHHLTADAVLSAAERGWRRLNPAAPTWSGQLDCVAGGPSCQGFSAIGRHDPLDARNELVFAFARLVKELAPRYFVLENVPGLLSPAYRSLVAQLIGEFEAAGYHLGGGPFVLNARSFGVPQDRRRVFIVGALRNERLPIKPIAMSGSVTALEALGDLPNADLFDELITSDEVSTAPDAGRSIGFGRSGYALNLREGPSLDAADLSAPRIWDRAKITSSKRTLHTTEVVDRFRLLPPGARDPVARLTRLAADRPSPTLRAGTGRDHGSFTSARPVHYEHPRVITVREAARLHSFPDWFRFHVTKWHGFRQVGNAVPPLLARAVTGAIASAASDRLPGRAAAIQLGDPSLLSYSVVAAAELYGVDPSTLPLDVRRHRSAAVTTNGA